MKKLHKQELTKPRNTPMCNRVMIQCRNMNSFGWSGPIADTYLALRISRCQKTPPSLKCCSFTALSIRITLNTASLSLSNSTQSSCCGIMVTVQAQWGTELPRHQLWNLYKLCQINENFFAMSYCDLFMSIFIAWVKT